MEDECHCILACSHFNECFTRLNTNIMYIPKVKQMHDNTINENQEIYEHLTTIKLINPPITFCQNITMAILFQVGSKILDMKSAKKYKKNNKI